jgi:hypothetical protein
MTTQNSPPAQKLRQTQNEQSLIGDFFLMLGDWMWPAGDIIIRNMGAKYV